MAINSGSCTKCTTSGTSAAFNIDGAAGHNMAWVYNSGSVIVHYEIGSGTATVFTGSPGVGSSILPPNSIKEIYMGEETSITLIATSGTPTVYVEPFSESVR